MRTLSVEPLCRSLLLFTALASSQVPAGETSNIPPLPVWQVLEYEQKAFFMTAKSRVEIAVDENNSEHWQLTASSSVASNSEEVTLDLTAANGRALYRSRLSKGKEQRYKTYRFLPEHIERVRRNPPPKTELPPCEWPVSSRRDIAYPQEAAGKVVTDAYALLALAARFHASGAEAAEVIVNTEFNFYLVRMTPGGDPPGIKVNYRLDNSKTAVTGKRNAGAVALAISPAGDQLEKYDFSLLGLNGDITILFDEESGLPLQLRGSAPRIGATEINLKSVTLRNPVL
tara:strand:+ start:43879 stop:44736 length:858 start_codon:yes stop_codon:yes gene_type:complete